MTRISLKLTDEKGKETEYVKNTTSLFWTAKAFELDNAIAEEKMNFGEIIRARAEFIADFFDDPSLTAEMVLKGLDVSDSEKMMDVFRTIMGVTTEATPEGEE